MSAERHLSSPTVCEPAPEHEIEVAEVDRLATADLRKVYRPTSLAVRDRAIARPNTTPLVAIVDGRVVGTVQYSVVGECLSFQSLGVHPAFRRRGIASALLGHLEKIARECGCKSVQLHTVRETGNVAIFECMGFGVVTEAPTALFENDAGTTLHEVLMRKSLDP